MIDSDIHTDEEELERARSRAEMIQGLYIHILVYLLVNTGLVAINMFATNGDGPWWSVWPLLGWGIGLLIHVAITVIPAFSDEWVDHRAHRIVERRHG